MSSTTTETMYLRPPDNFDEDLILVRYYLYDKESFSKGYMGIKFAFRVKIHQCWRDEMHAMIRWYEWKGMQFEPPFYIAESLYDHQKKMIAFAERYGSLANV